MTMQVASAPAPAALPDAPAGYPIQSRTAAAPVTALAPAWMVDLKPALIGRLRASLTATTPGAATLSDRDVLARVGLLTASGDLTPEALLLFGTEHALAQAYPFLKTSVSRRDLDRFREKITELPRNLIRQIDALLDFMQDEVPPTLETMQADPDSRDTNQASQRDAAVIPWIFEMAISRDYGQIKPARLVRDNTSLCLEYPRALKNQRENQNASPSRYQVNKILEAVLTRLYPHARAAATMQVDRGEEAHVKGHLLRTEGRFFKITAILPHASLPIALAPQDHASPAPTIGQAQPTHDTMQAEQSPSTPAVIPSRPSANGHHGASKHPGPSAQPPTAPASSTSPASLVPRSRPESAHRPTLRGTPGDRTARILEFCRTPRHREEIQKLEGMNNRDHFRKDVLNRLIAQGLLAPTLPDKPNSPKQQYVAVPVPADSAKHATD